MDIHTKDKYTIDRYTIDRYAIDIYTIDRYTIEYHTLHHTLHHKLHHRLHHTLHQSLSPTKMMVMWGSPTGMITVTLYVGFPVVTFMLRLAQNHCFFTGFL